MDIISLSAFPNICIISSLKDFSFTDRAIYNKHIIFQYKILLSLLLLEELSPSRWKQRSLSIKYKLD